MKSVQWIGRALLIVIFVFSIVACNDNDKSTSNSHNHDDDHDHEITLLLTHKNTTALTAINVEDKAIENLLDDAPGNNAQIALATNGEVAALQASGTVAFIHGQSEDDLPFADDYSLSGESVVSTQGHFSILENGQSKLVSSEALESDQPTFEFIDIPNQTHPAILLDEEHEITLIFANDTATVYEDTVATEQQFACISPSAVAQAAHLVIVNCNDGNHYLTYHEKNEVHTYSNGMLEGANQANQWVSNQQQIIGWPGLTNGSFITVSYDEDHESVESTHSSAIIGGDTNNELCSLAIEPDDLSVFTISASGQFSVIAESGELIKTLTLDESSALVDCADLTITSSEGTAYVLDTDINKLYVIDNEENTYHIHSRIELPSESQYHQIIAFQSLDSDHDEHDHGDEDEGDGHNDDDHDHNDDE